MLIDTHSHLFEEEFDADRHEAVERAERAGVERIVLPAIERSSNERLFEMCREYPHLAVPLMGLHPTSINENPDWREELHEVERWLTTPPAGVERFYGVSGRANATTAKAVIGSTNKHFKRAHRLDFFWFIIVTRLVSKL